MPDNGGALSSSGFCDTITRMVADTPDKTADKTVLPQNTGGAAQSGDDAPVFVANQQEFFAHMKSVNASAHRWMSGKGFFLVCPALAYGLFFLLAGWFSPQFYQAWLDFCMPLAEYVGGMTPRTGRIAGELVAGGYPERVDDATHAIAMARVMLFPLYISWLMAFVSALTSTPSAIVSCSRQTRARIWLMAFGCFAVAVIFFCANEFIFGEDFHSTAGRGRMNYHRGNDAIFLDMGFWWAFLAMSAIGCIRLLMLRTVRFNIVNYNTANWR